MSFCTKCGAYIPIDDTACPACGYDSRASRNQSAAAAALRTVPVETQSEEPLFSWGSGAETTEEKRRILAGRIKVGREKLGLSQKELADRLSVSAQRVSGWERALILPELQQLRSLLELFSVDPAEVYAASEVYLQIAQAGTQQKNSALPADRSSKNRRSGRKKTFKAMTAILLAVVLMGMVGGVWALSYDFPDNGCYYRSDTDTVYYYEGRNFETDEYEWWSWTRGDEDWELRCTYEGKKEAPRGVKRSRGEYSQYAMEEKLGYSVPSIYTSRAYLDVHYYEPSEGYYYYKGTMYYYLCDPYGEQYGAGDNSGWYVFDADSGEWSYLCDYTDKDTLGELWYTISDFYLWNDASVLYGIFPDGVWTSDSYFDKTIYYQNYEAAARAFDIIWGS